jgi:hypothetical protein
MKYKDHLHLIYISSSCFLMGCLILFLNSCQTLSRDSDNIKKISHDFLDEEIDILNQAHKNDVTYHEFFRRIINENNHC